MAPLDFGSGSPRDVLAGVVNFISSGGKLGTLLQGSIFGIIASIALGGVNLIQSIIGFITAPLDAGGEAVGVLFNALLTAPANILVQTARQSALGISLQFPVAAFIVGVIEVLVALYLVSVYLNEDETGDTFLGLPVDIPDLGPLQIGVEEEAEADE